MTADHIEAHIEARIIPFPVSKRVAGPDSAAGHERLSQALGHLSEALSSQQHAIALWRERLNNLQSAVGHLGGNVRTYAGRLEVLGREVAMLRGQADALNRMADSMTALQR